MSRGVLWSCALLLALAANHAASQAHLEPHPAEPARLAEHSLLLDLAQAGQRLVAVGERGHVLTSGDGRTWEQAEFVPVRATLTRVTFAGGRLWAVGHDSTIIHSRDLGRTWSLQHFEPEWEKPLLDVHFFDANRGIAIGAYGLFMRTEDAGRNWEVVDMSDLVTSEDIDWEEAARAALEEDDFGFDDVGFEDDDEFGDNGDDWYDAASDFDRGCYEFLECHLNAFLDLGDGRQIIAAERGYGFRSEDGGETWEAFRFPYAGSMFGLLPAGPDSVLAFGLRGHVQYSSDFGRNWEMFETGLSSSLKGGALDPQGRPFMVGAGAARLTFDPQTRRFSLREDRLGGTFSAVLFTTDGRMILTGQEGVIHE